MEPTNGMTPLPQPGQPTLGQTLGLGVHWQPAPGAWGIAGIQTPVGKQYVLSLHTVGGVIGLALTGDDCRRLAAQLTEAATGLVLPT